jgi:hypothetical protein
MFFYRYMKQHAMFLPLKVSQLAWRAPGDAAMIISFSLVCKTKISTWRSTCKEINVQAPQIMSNYEVYRLHPMPVDHGNYEMP